MGCIYIFIIYMLASAMFVNGLEQFATSKDPRIAVIGAGIGGASASHFLRTLFEDSCTIEVYEAHRVGGRLAVTNVDGQLYETGGSVIHPRNQYMLYFAKLLGLEERESLETRLGLYDGKEYPFVESSWEITNYFKMFWRYGTSILKLPRFIDRLLEDFSRIYSLQDEGQTFKTPKEMLTAMDPTFGAMTQISSKFYLKLLGFSDRFINELLMSITRVNYGQTPDINAFVGAVALAGAEPGLWSIKGGNYQVPELLLKNSNVTLVMRKVTKVVLQKTGMFEVYSVNSASRTSDVVETYDIVILATPLASGMSGIEFEGTPMPAHYFKGSYQRTVATITNGILNRTHVNLGDDGINLILTTNTDVYFNSLGVIYPVSGIQNEVFAGLNVWKVFSSRLLTESELDVLFINRSHTYVEDWLAYPRYEPPDDLGGFVLHHNLFYLNCIEWAASAMEMSAIAGRNIALLAHHSWTGKTEQSQTNIRDGHRKTEL